MVGFFVVSGFTIANSISINRLRNEQFDVGEFCAARLFRITPPSDNYCDFSRPGKPTDNAFVETFNACVRAECLNAHVFELLEDAKNILINWRSDYNYLRTAPWVC